MAAARVAGTSMTDGDRDGLPPEAVRRRVEAARAGSRDAVLEGVHALKHAARFGAAIELVVTPDRDALLGLLAELAPDVPGLLEVPIREVDRAVWEACCPYGVPSPALALAPRPAADPGTALAADAPVVVLEDPTHLGNVGAVVRVAAAAGMGGVLVVGDADPWHPRALRGGAGLQFALPVVRADALPPTDRPVVAVDPGGTPLARAEVPADALVAFGTERHGLSGGLADRAEQRVAIPMREGVSSLNLATAVAVVCYDTRVPWRMR